MSSPITIETLRALMIPAGADLLADLSNADLSESNSLRLITELRKKHPIDLAAAALELARLRVRGREKFGARADTMFFTREALEQATDWRVSRARFQGLHPSIPVLDLGCGIGGDSYTLAEAGLQVTGIDLDPLRLLMARTNVSKASFVQADLRSTLPVHPQKPPVIFFDPARRTEDSRVFSLKKYIPPLETIETWRFSELLVKLSPGVDMDELREYLHPGDGLVFISLDGDLKEAVLMRGRESMPERRAIVVDKSGAWLTFEGNRAEIGVSDPRGWLYEPDPAIIRAGLVQDIGAQINASLIDPTIAYLISDEAVETPYARRWQIIDWMPFNLKKLKEYLREHHIGRVTVKKRGSPITPEELIAKLKLPNTGEERVIVLTRVQGNPAILICYPPTH